MSKYEDNLWRLMNLAGLPLPVRQHFFARDFGRLYRWDFAWPDLMLAVEVDGGRFLGRGRGRRLAGAPLGYHGSPEDNRKRNLANLLGWTVLVYGPEMIHGGEAVLELRIALDLKMGRPWRDKMLKHVADTMTRESLQRKRKNAIRELRRQEVERPRPGRRKYL